MSENNKRVVQISLDILVGSEESDFVEEVADELERHGFTVLSASFIDELTDFYQKNYPEMMTLD